MLFNQLFSKMGLPFGIIYLGIILGLAYLFFITVPKAMQTKQWSEIQGKVTNNELAETNKQHPRKHERITAYSVNVEYQYEVDGQTYTGAQNKLSDRNANSSKIEAAVQNEYAIGASIPVFYNPKAPAQSILQQGITSLHYALGSLLLLALAFMTYFWLRK